MLAVGPGGLDKDGKRVSCSVTVGDKVLIPQVSLVCSSPLIGGRLELKGGKGFGLGLWVIG